jgi:hypothetical protein
MKLTTEFHLEQVELHLDTRQVLSVRSASAQNHCYLSASTEPNYRVLNTCSLVAYPEQFVSVRLKSRFVHVGFVVLAAVTVTSVVQYFAHASEA